MLPRSRYVPGGKTQLVMETFDNTLAAVYRELDRTLTEAKTFAKAIQV